MAILLNLVKSKSFITRIIHHFETGPNIMTSKYAIRLIHEFSITGSIARQRRHWRFSQCFYEKSRGGDFLFTKNTADDIVGFTAACVVGVLGAINCEYRQTFMFAMCGIVTFLM